MDMTEFYIDGAWVAPSDAARLDVIDPSTGLSCATISLGNAVDVDKAVAAAVEEVRRLSNIVELRYFKFVLIL